MAGPWEKYGTAPAAEAPAGPWAKYGAPAAPPVAAPAWTPPAPPPGEIIHGAATDTSTTDPSYSVARQAAKDSSVDARNEADRSNMIAGQALKARANMDTANDGGGAAARRKVGVANQGTTFGWGDELLSAIMAGTGAVGGQNFGDRYDLAQEIQRQDLEKERADHPLQSLALEAAGGLASGINLARNGVTLAGRFGSSIIPRILAGGAEGAAYGALSGAGAGDGTEDRARRAAANIPLGAAIGAAAIPVGDLVSGVGGTLVNWYRGARDPAGRAQQLLVQRIMEDGGSPEAIAKAMQDARAAGQPEFAMVDAGGKNLQRTATVAAQTPGPFREQASQQLVASQAGQADRLGGFIDDALGQRGNAAHQTEQDLIAARRAASQPAYDEAYQAPTPSGQSFTDLLTRQSVREAMPAARATAAERQIPVSSLFDEVPNPNAQTIAQQVDTGLVDASGAPIMRSTSVVDNPTVEVPTVRGWDFVKRELDAKTNQLFKAGDTTRAGAVKETRDQLRNALGEEVPAYARALQQYSDESALIDAITSGRNLARASNPDEAAAAFSNLTPEQQSLARLGAARELRAPLENAAIGRDKTLPFTSRSANRKMDILATDPAARQQFAERLGREQAMRRSANELRGGSDTFEKLADAGPMGDRSGSLLAALVTGQFGRATGLTIDALSRAAQGVNPEVAEQLGQYVLSTNPEMVQGLSSLFAQRVRDAAMPSVVPAAASGAFNAPRSQDRRK